MTIFEPTTLKPRPQILEALLGIVAVLVGLGAPMAASADAQNSPEAGAPDPALVERADKMGISIERANVPSKSGPAFGVATGIVQAPLAKVLKSVTEYPKYAEFMPHFKKSKVLSRRGDNAILYLEVAILKGAATLWTNVKIFARKPQGKTRIIEARMIKGKGNMGQFVARWELTPVDAGRTMVHFRILVDPDLPVPSSLIDSQNMKAAYKAIKAVRKRVS